MARIVIATDTAPNGKSPRQFVRGKIGLTWAGVAQLLPWGAQGLPSRPPKSRSRGSSPRHSIFATTIRTLS